MLHTHIVSIKFRTQYGQIRESSPNRVFYTACIVLERYAYRIGHGETYPANYCLWRRPIWKTIVIPKFFFITLLFFQKKIRKKKEPLFFPSCRPYPSGCGGALCALIRCVLQMQSDGRRHTTGTARGGQLLWFCPRDVRCIVYQV